MSAGAPGRLVELTSRLTTQHYLSAFDLAQMQSADKNVAESELATTIVRRPIGAIWRLLNKRLNGKGDAG